MRATMSMANLRSGGDIVIGVDEDSHHQPVFTGLNKTELASFHDAEAISGHVNGFASPGVRFELYHAEHPEFEGINLVVFRVEEFDRQCIICKKDGQDQYILHKDDTYVRSAKAPFGSIRATEIELREIIEMAVDKEATQLKQRGWKRSDADEANQLYEAEIADL